MKPLMYYWYLFHLVTVDYTFYLFKDRKEIWLSPMTNAHTPTEKSKKHRDNIKKNATKNLDYTTIADRLRAVS